MIKKTGFTIVELLIVIVVIGVLAALVLNSFASAQVQARNAARIRVAGSYQKILLAYAAQYGAYPNNPNYCLGEFNNNAGKCTKYDGTEMAVNSSMITELKKVSPNLPENQYSGAKGTNGTVYMGPHYDYYAPRVVDGQSKPSFLIYFLETSTAKCGLSGLVEENGSATNFKSSTTRTYDDLGITTCYISLPNPG